jgi:hypothetical protein
MNLNWSSLTSPQRKALLLLSEAGPCALPQELGEQLCNLGLAERIAASNFCISALGTTVPPSTVH